MKKPKKILLIILLTFISSQCVVSSKFEKAFWHDYDNPCTKGPYYNGIECENWKKNYPKNYEKYRERMKKYYNVSN
jgi:hypothetical protein